MISVAASVTHWPRGVFRVIRARHERTERAGRGRAARCAPLNKRDMRRQWGRGGCVGNFSIKVSWPRRAERLFLVLASVARANGQCQRARHSRKPSTEWAEEDCDVCEIREYGKKFSGKKAEGKGRSANGNGSAGSHFRASFKTRGNRVLRSHFNEVVPSALLHFSPIARDQ